jgi:RepB DNA-primase N-terminal domain
MLTSSRPDTRLLDRGEAERFLTALDPTADKWTSQSFDDNQDRKDKSLARVLHGTLARNWSALVELNERGAGVFVTINKTDFAGRKKANIKSVRALFSDLDGAPLDPVLAEGEPKPHILTETSPGKYHTYWRAADVPLEEFTPTQKVIAKRYGSDPQVNDLPRVMRLPGFIHRKGEPFLSRLVQANDFDPYTWAELSKIFRDEWKGYEAPKQVGGTSSWRDLNTIACARGGDWFPALFRGAYQSGNTWRARCTPSIWHVRSVAILWTRWVKGRRTARLSPPSSHWHAPIADRPRPSSSGTRTSGCSAHLAAPSIYVPAN